VKATAKSAALSTGQRPALIPAADHWISGWFGVKFYPTNHMMCAFKKLAVLAEHTIQNTSYGLDILARAHLDSSFKDRFRV
jgi:hypothetical protein